MKSSDLMVKALENEGVEYIFGIPGEENLDFLNSLKDSSIQLILTRHEQAAGFMAATYGRLTGKPGVCLSTLGPGATNLVTAAAYAQLGGMPMLMLTGQKPIKKSKQGRFQIVDVVDMMKPLTKFTRQIVNGNNIPALVREAFRVAMEERPGAVHLELPEDVAAEEAGNQLFETNHIRRANPELKSLRKAVEMIQNAKRPLLLIGAGANRKRTSRALLEFINKTGIYFFNTQMGKGVIDERHPLYLGTAALSDHDYLHCALERSDLIVNVGHDVIEKPPFFMEQGGKKVIHVNFFAAQVDEVYFPQLNLVGDIAFSIKELTRLIENSAQWDFDYFSRIKTEVDKHIANNSENDQFPLLPQFVVAELRKALPENGILTLDNGVYKIWFARNFASYFPNSLLLDNALATMGAGFPSAMAAKMVYPDKAVVAVCGDGGFMMNSQELETAVRLGLNLVIVILNDSAYGMIKWKQAALDFTNYGLDYGNPDFVKYAESYGAHGHRVKVASDFRKMLESCIQQKGVHVIDVPVDYEENHKVLNEELRAKTCIL